MPNLKRRWTAADLRDLPDDGNRYEVIDGELLVSPAPAWRHQRAVAALWSLINAYAMKEGIGQALLAPADVEFSDDRLVQPDVFVTPLVNGRRPEHFDDVGRRLLLAVEVLSPSTARADRVKKRVMFRDEHVPEFWVVDLDSCVIERSTPADPRVEILAERVTWMPEGAAAALDIDLSSYFTSVLDS